MGVTWITPVEITPDSASAWTDVDLSSYVASGTTGVLLHIVNTHATTEYNFGCRKNGSSDNRFRAIYQLTHLWMSCGVDLNRISEIYVASTTSLDVYLVGYFDSSAVFNTNATDISLSSTGAWTDIDINVDDNAVGAIVEVVSGADTYGLRCNGSTDNRYIYLYRLATVFIGVDENEICEGKISHTDVDFYLMGYIKSEVTFLTNATDLSMTTTGSYADLTALPEGSIGGFIEVIESSTPINYALRKNGSSEDIYQKIHRHCWATIECDTSHLIEGKIASTNTDFFLTAYTTGVASQNLLLTGISSTVSIGTPLLYEQLLSLTGISSTASIGTPTLVPGNTNVVLIGIDSTVSIGSIGFGLGNVNLSLVGIISTVSIGTPTITSNYNLSLSGISSTSSIGNITFEKGNVNLSLIGISSNVSIGIPIITVNSQYIEPIGINSTVSIGNITFSLGTVALPLTGIESTSSIGTLDFVKGNVNLQLSGIPSTTTFGTPSITTLQQILSLSGISSTLTIGTPVLTSNYNLALNGIVNTNIFGNFTYIASNVNLPLIGINSSVSMGSLVLRPGNIDLSLSGIPSSCSIGNITLSSNYNLALTGISSSTTIGTPTITTPSNGITWINPVEITPAVAGAWTDVDLSAYVQDGTSGVMLHVETTDVRLDWGARKNGSTDDRHIENYYASHTGFSVGIDENKVLELYVESITDVNVYLVGYMDFCAVFNTNATDVSLGSTGAWTDIDINVDDNAVGAIIEVYNTGYNSSREFGIRKNGSSDNRHTYLLGKTSAFIGVDNDILEGYIGNTGVDFYLTGYVKSGITFLTNATDLSMTTTGSYADLTALPEGSIGGFIEYSSPELSVYNGALRVNGSSEDIYRSLVRHGWLPVQCDANHLIEGKISSTNLDFFLTGYATVASQYMNLAGIPSTVTIGNISLNHLLSVTGINSTVNIGTISFSVGNTNLVLSGINSTLTIGSINLFNTTSTTIYKLTTQITSRDISIDIVKRNIGLTVTDRDISVGITRRNIDISAVEREIDMGIEVT